ncbi:trans-aconitate methyltransferase [Streptomyces cinnamoneus]|uniref:Trans-aconitate 2-methyltransferase n=1 Tax=Streptomyces cinnamoneus TaxID=53446 RepID=A0A2G1XJ33_STRCJ|nr:trans-aconitate 2-methyltransferase [Streptomyces cinnamoneus]PHQ51233.1 trans-aconitate methyltransferase [Streptomyces cinnamoneus]PPT13543.1 methyltransferase domain-containing protein [Streptomyces cinnamoneus]
MPCAPTPLWDPRQYLRHAEDRSRPFTDLLARVPALPGQGRRPARIADLGCGAGNVTALLAERWRDARVTGYDNSAAMLREADAYAGRTLGGGSIAFARADLTDWSPDPAEPLDLIVSNAAFQWVPGHAGRFPVWLAGLAAGGTFAFQVPGNGDAPSHALLRQLCASVRWRDRLGEAGRRRVEVLDPAQYLARLTDLGCEVDTWETTYAHLLPGEDPVLDWVKGTGLRPVLTALAGDLAATQAFLAEYGALLREAYPAGPGGTVFPFRRVFVVARKRD